LTTDDHHIAALTVFARCSCGYEVRGDSESHAEDMLANHVSETGARQARAEAEKKIRDALAKDHKRLMDQSERYRDGTSWR
jgi:hypothetical protein